LVTFSYAHVPCFKANQKKLERFHIPGPDEKLEMLEASYELLTNSEYQAIGMDHYSKPNDELYVALQNKELHRNFQGYCTRETTGQVYAFGTTAISQLTDGYAQNVRSVNEYIDRISTGDTPLLRGYILNEQEQLIRETINEVMCNHYVDLSEMAAKYDISIEDLYKILDFQPKKLEPFIEDNLVDFENYKIEVTNKGFFLIRNIAMTLDPMLQNKENQYSKTI
jgi:oxygen-independent coproporphyrinogen-3 oxidase